MNVYEELEIKLFNKTLMEINQNGKIIKLNDSLDLQQFYLDKNGLDWENFNIQEYKNYMHNNHIIIK